MSIVYIKLILLVTALNLNTQKKDLTITVYYESYYKRLWFKDFSNYKIVFEKFSYKSNYATDIISMDNYNKDICKIYLIDKPLLFNIHNKKNFNIRGLSFTGKNLAVVTLQMSDKNITKVITHEFAHCLGLSHCTHTNCIMNDAKGKFSNLKNCNTFKNSCLLFMKDNSKLILM